MKFLRKAAVDALRLLFFGALVLGILAFCGMVLSFRLATKLYPHPVA